MKTYIPRVLVLAFMGFHALAAQAWPDKPVRLVAPAPAGGIVDALARQLAEQMGKELNQPVIVENKPGAGGSIAIQYMLAAPADGHTLVLTGSNVLTETPHVLHPPYDSMKDVVALAPLGKIRSLLVSAPALPASDMASLGRYIQSQPGKLSFASASPGTVSHYGGELLNQRLGTDMQHVPFPGSPPALVAVMGQQVTMFFDNVVTSTPLLKAGKIKAFGIAGTTRSPLLPNVPTFQEQGYPEFNNFSNWMLLASSAKLPAATQTRIQELTLRIARAPAFQARVVEMGFDSAGPETPEEFRKALLSDYNWAGSMARKLKLTP